MSAAALGRTHAGEGVAIVVSIVLAFAIDAWWDDRKERSEEAALLADLREDFEASLVDNDRVIDKHREHLWRREAELGGPWSRHEVELSWSHRKFGAIVDILDRLPAQEWQDAGARLSD